MKRAVKAIAVVAGVFITYLMLHYACAWILPFGTHVNTMCANGVMMLSTVVFAFGCRRSPLKTIGGDVFSVRAVPFAIGVGIGMCFLVRLMLLTVPFPDSWNTSYTVRVQAVQEPTVWRWLSVLAVAPLAEEIVFRGVIYRVLRGAMPWVAATGLSAALFAVLHGTPMWILYTWLLGFVLCRVYDCTKSVWLCAAAHAAFNFAGQTAIIGVLPTGAAVMLFAVGILTLVLCLWCLEKTKRAVT